MIVNYVVQAILISLYLFVHVAADFDWIPKNTEGSFSLSRLVSAVGESTRVFLDATLVFCVSVLVATIYTSSTAMPYFGRAMTTTATVSSMFISLYSVLPAVVLHSAASGHLRRKRGRTLVWIFIGVLFLVSVALYYSTPYNPWNRWWNDPNWNLKDDGDHQVQWEMICLHKKIVDRGNIAITIGIGILGLIVALYMFFICNLFRIPFFNSERNRILNKLRDSWWLVSATLAFVAMWVCLGLFLGARKSLNKYTGSTNKDREWTFGQVLALATWAPVLIELVYIWVQGAEKGLTGIMTDRYLVFEDVDLSEKKHVYERASESSD